MSTINVVFFIPQCGTQQIISCAVSGLSSNQREVCFAHMVIVSQRPLAIWKNTFRHEHIILFQRCA